MMLRRAARPLVLAGCVALAACAGGSHRAVTAHSRSGPGPAGDPWGPYIREASQRHNVPQSWIRAVMQQESGGHEYLNGRPTTSYAGATGLMQVMPGTYAELRGRYDLGPDPYDPHDNILAGTAYIREMADRYGAPGFLAAYNAGPGRMDDYLANGTPLPDQTVDYLAAVTPHLGTEVAMTGPLSVYATRAQPRAYASAAPAALPPAAEPDYPQLAAAPSPEPSPEPPSAPPPARPPEVSRPRSALSAAVYGGAPPAAEIAARPADAAPPSQARFPVARPQLPILPPRPPQVTYRLVTLGPAPRPAPAAYRTAAAQARVERGGHRPGPLAAPVTARLGAPGPRRGYAIQLGGFATPGAARAAAARLRATVALPESAAPGVAVASGHPNPSGVFLARIDNLSEGAASAACLKLRAQKMACAVVSGG